jgi:spermidine synthase
MNEAEHGQLLMEPLNDSTGFYIRASRQVGEWQTRLHKLAIYDTPHYGQVFCLDGHNLTSEREEFVCHENLIHPALTAHVAPKKLLIIGGGDGGAAEEALKHPSVEQLTLCVADEELVKIAREHFFAVHRGAFDNPKLKLVIGDGTKLVREAHERFDLIALDLNDPMGPSEALYSVEFMQHCRAALAPGGAVVLHIGAPVARPERRGRAGAAHERHLPHRPAVHHVRAALRRAVGDGGVLGQAGPQVDHRRRDRPAHRAAQAARPQVLQRRDARRRVRAAELHPRPGQPAAPEAAGSAAAAWAWCTAAIK